MASSGSMERKSSTISRIAAPTMKEVVDRNIESLATDFFVFAPATVSTVLINAMEMLAISNHFISSVGDTSFAKLSVGTKRNRQDISTSANPISENTKPATSTPLRARISE